jgi:hypothetical protein
VVAAKPLSIGKEDGMKHHVVFVIMPFAVSLLLTVPNAVAQRRFDAGFKGGVDFAQFLGGGTGGFVDLSSYRITGDMRDTRVGFTGGIFATVHMARMFGFQLEALYAQKGGSGQVAVTQGGVTIIDTEVTLELDYIELPVLVVVFFPLGGITEVSGFGGVSFGFNTSAKATGSGGSVDIDGLVKGTDYSAVLGLGASFKVGSVMIVADGRWTYGLDSIDNTPRGGDIHNSTITLMTGIAFPLGMPQ